MFFYNHNILLADHLPRYLWGPPPPYSQPPSIENIREATEVSGNDVIPTGSSADTTTVSTMVPASMTPARTTRSGILQQQQQQLQQQQQQQQINNKDYDDTVKSAMHLYERTANVINSNSLPSRRIRKNMKSNLKSYMAQSVANLQRTLKEEEEAALFTEVRQKLNALNGMYRYQHSKAAQELAEIRRALNSLQTSGPTSSIPTTGNGSSVYKQNLPLPPIPKKDLIYEPPSVISSNSCSTENKYETIGKSLEPYKIDENDKKTPKRLPSTGSSYSSSGSSVQAGDYGFASSGSPMSVATITGHVTNGSQSPSSSSDDIGSRNLPSQQKVSSHYAQISPLRGQGLPPPSMMGVQPNSGSGHNSVTSSPVKSYFQVSYEIM